MADHIRFSLQQVCKVHCLHGRYRADTFLPGNAHRAVRSDINGIAVTFFRKAICFRQLYRLGGFFHFCLGCRATKLILIDQAYKLQPLEKGVKLRLVIGLDHSVHRFKVNGSCQPNGCKIIGQVGVILTVFKLFAKLGANGRVVQIIINPIQRAELQKQLRGGLRTDTCNTGNVVGAVTHQSLQVHKLLWFKAVFLTEFFRVIQCGCGLPRTGYHQLHMDMLIDKLQTVTVTCNDHTFPIVVSADPANCSNNIVSFPSLTFVDRDIHSLQHLLHNRHLHSQLLGHSMSGSLVSVIFFVTECRTVEIKGDADRLRLLLLLHALQNIQEAVDGMGIQSVPGSQRLDTKIGTVDYTVTV